MRRWLFPTFVLLIYPAAGVGLAAPGASFRLQTRSLEHFAWAFADFDGDNQLDFARAKPRSQGYVLELELSSKRSLGSAEWPALASLPSSAFGLHVQTQDVDGDNDLDIVVTWGFARLPVAVWINDGQGRFAEDNLGMFASENHPVGFLCPKSIPDEWHAVLSPTRPFGFGLAPGGRLVRPIFGSSGLFASRPQQRIFFSPGDKQSARAPPVLFS